MHLLTPKEAGEYLKVSINTLATWRHLKKGPAFVMTGRTVKYSMEALDGYLKKNTVKTTERKK